jgi:GDSL-like Lipase/Acylhydrolase
MKNIFKYSSFILVSALLVQSCKPDLKAPEGTAGTANFAKYVAVGNSLTAGYADGGLYLEGQKVAYPNLIAEQMKAAGIGANDFSSPLFSDDQKNGAGYVILKGFGTDGSPITAKVQTQLAYDFTKPNPLAGGFYFKPYVGSIYTNFGIPGIRLSSITGLVAGLYPYGAVNPYMHRLVSGTANAGANYIDWVASQNATFFSLWLGNNDVLGYATTGGADLVNNPITPGSAFKSLYELAIAKMIANGAKGVVATIPDVTAIPYFNTVLPSKLRASLALVQAGAPTSIGGAPVSLEAVAVYRDNTGAVKELTDDLLICLTADSIGAIKGPGIPPKGFGFKLKAAFGPYPIGFILSSYPLDNSDVLEPNEQAAAKAAVIEFNSIITKVAADNNLALFDANAFLANVKGGIVIDGTSVNSAYISGGAFSMDGVHLTPKGNAMAANGFIDAINSKYGSNIAKVTVTKYQGVKVQ